MITKQQSLIVVLIIIAAILALISITFGGSNDVSGQAIPVTIPSRNLDGAHMVICRVGYGGNIQVWGVKPQQTNKPLTVYLFPPTVCKRWVFQYQVWTPKGITDWCEPITGRRDEDGL